MKIRDICDVEKIVNMFDSFADRSPKGQDVWGKGYFPLKKGDIRKLAKAISDLEVKLTLNDDKLRKYINNFLSARHGFKYDGILARDLAQALKSKAGEIIIKKE